MKTTTIRVFAIVLAVCLLMAGCSKDPGEISGKVEAAPAPAATQAPVETEAAVEETQPAEENPLSLGRLEGGTYTNAYAGFGCQLDSGWTFLSAEELQQLPEQVAGQLEDTEMAEILGGYEQITDMMAENVELLCSMNVLYQKVSLQERAIILAMGEGETIDMLVEENGEIMKSSYAQMGVNVTSMSRKEVQFLGQQRSALYTEATTEGVPVYMVQLFDYSRGNYSVTTTFSSYVEDNTQTMMDLFFEVE